MAVADSLAEAGVLDHLAHVLQDLGGGRDRRAGPGLEAVAEGVEIAVGADAGVAVRDPGAAEGVLRLEHQEARARRLRGEVPGGADAGDAGADDDDVEDLGGRCVGRVRGGAGVEPGVHVVSSSGHAGAAEPSADIIASCRAAPARRRRPAERQPPPRRSAGGRVRRPGLLRRRCHGWRAARASARRPDPGRAAGRRRPPGGTARRGARRGARTADRRPSRNGPAAR